MINSFLKPLILTICAVAISVTSIQALGITGSLDGSYEGLADSTQKPITAGVLRLGWFDTGILESQLVSFFNAGDLGSIDAVFHEMAFTTDMNTNGAGLPFESFTFVEDGDVNGLASYKDPQMGAAGKQAFAWFMDTPLGITGNPTQMALLTSSFIFPTAADDLEQTDFSGTFSLDSSAPGIHVIIGSFAAVFSGSGVDLNDGSPLDSKGRWGGSNVLMTAAIPEPSSAVLVLAGAVLLGRLKRKLSK